jgi:hypothetical protein
MISFMGLELNKLLLPYKDCTIAALDNLNEKMKARFLLILYFKEAFRVLADTINKSSLPSL